jgi:hypothetical protein
MHLDNASNREEMPSQWGDTLERLRRSVDSVKSLCQFNSTTAIVTVPLRDFDSWQKFLQCPFKIKAKVIPIIICHL